MKLLKKIVWLLLCLLLVLSALIFFEFREMTKAKSSVPVDVKIVKLPKPK